ncbi:MAG: sulfurase [Rhodobacterales bacterium]|nr:sulfurase [Rhodobacterales bacterium]
MPALIATEHVCRITWLGRVAGSAADLRSAPVQQAMLSLDGMTGDCHAGRTRPACSRVTALYSRGRAIANTRQISIVSAEELRQIAGKMGLAELDPSWIGASMVVEGIADFSHLPPSSRLQGRGGATLVIDMQNRPCQLPAKVIEAERPGQGRAFKRAAAGRRGVTAWVECEGIMAVGEILRLFVPDQRGWRPPA